MCRSQSYDELVQSGLIHSGLVRPGLFRLGLVCTSLALFRRIWPRPAYLVRPRLVQHGLVQAVLFQPSFI